MVILTNLVQNLSLEKKDERLNEEELAVLSNHFVSEVECVCNDERVASRLHVIDDEEDLKKIRSLVSANITIVKRYLRSL